MIFSAPLFLFLFLPVVLLGYFLLPGLRLRNAWLLVASLVFYGWGEPGFILILLVSVAMNYWFGRLMEAGSTPTQRQAVLMVGIVGNLGLLAYFKYFNLGLETVNGVLEAIGVKRAGIAEILLPLGISFFTFHALSYLIDIYRGKQRAARNPLEVALYIFFFPQLIAGPILRWHAIAPQLADREHSRAKFAEGVRRFVKGLGKKILIANTVGLPADQIFSLPASQLTTADAWLGAVCYTLQIYFDFSGYSDMAVGLGKMFGFRFLENFNFPYIAESIRDFWRRWHISLSTWFRDYVYVPLGGNRVSAARTSLNLVLVFFLCGLWHGANWTFVAWGLYHGLFLLLERTSFGSVLTRLPRALRHGYVLLTVLIGWVIFRSEDFVSAAKYLSALAGFGCAPDGQPWMRFATRQVLFGLILGVVAATPWPGQVWARIDRATQRSPAWQTVGSGLEVAGIVGLFFVSIVWLVGGDYNPFIYFRF